ncbi:TXNRD3 [Symbiodinium necroappetens]|uniref:thioredoxin-disulfide reductase (NADPH) n=1 Tax=Symbiodinium necroappetens TaxID=1628268 RepID=A0A813B820_9DINO|nr:TXNRD3 [Symbiodinium necroappetens]
MRITDLRALAKLAHQKGVLLSVDSTMMPPVICQPLLLGVDIVVHSATKFFSGHADCTGGLVCVRDPELAHRVAFLQNAEGTALAPFECFLFLRGIKTMWLRVSRAQENAQEIAKFLSRHSKVTGVFFPGPGGCDNRALRIHQSQSSGPGCVISFTTGSVGFSRRLLDASRLFKTTVSFGSVNSLGEMPCTMSHASIPAEQQTLPQDLVRLSVGIEDVRDLLLDLQRALETASGQREQPSNDQYDSRFDDLPVVPRLPGGTAEETDGHDDASGLQRGDSLVGFLAAQAQQKRPGLALLGVAAVSALTLGALAAARSQRRCAGFIAGFGFDVTVMVRSILLRGFDQDIANMIGQYMQKHGVNFAREMVPSKFEKTADGKVKVFVKDAEYGVFDTVLVAIGRAGCASQLNVEAAGLSYNPKTGKVVVDDNDQTSVPNIFAIGDVCEGKPELTPVAIQAGRMLTRRLFAGSTKKMDYTDIATTVFTPIEYGCVGYSEDEAREKISKERIKVYHCTAQPLEWNLNSERKDDMGYMKLIVDKEEKEKVVGVHILGPNAGEIIQGLSVAIRCGVTKEHFDDCVGIHPTFAESYTTMTEEKTEGSALPTKGGC